MEARLVSLSGQVAARQSWPLVSESMEWHLPDALSPGVYYLEIRMSDRTSTIPVVIER